MDWKEQVKQAKKGSSEAFSELYDNSYKLFYSTCRKYTSNEQEIEDILQETYVTIYQQLKKLKKEENFLTWGNTICRNAAIDYLRKKNVHEGQDDLKPDTSTEEYEGMDVLPVDTVKKGMNPEANMDAVVLQEILMEILDTLSPNQRACILLWADGYKTSEIAKELDLSEGTVKSSIHYAKKQIKLEVETVEKEQNIKLHAMAPLPFFLFLLKGYDAHAAEVSVAGNAAQTATQVVTKEAVQAAIQQTATETAKGAATGAAKTAAAGISTKAIALATAGIIALGGTGVGTGVYLHNHADSVEAGPSDMAVSCMSAWAEDDYFYYDDADQTEYCIKYAKLDGIGDGENANMLLASGAESVSLSLSSNPGNLINEHPEVLILGDLIPCYAGRVVDGEITQLEETYHTYSDLKDTVGVYSTVTTSFNAEDGKLLSSTRLEDSYKTKINYSYDEEGLVEKININSQSDYYQYLSYWKLSYNEQHQISLMKYYSDDELCRTFTFAYTDDQKLDSVTCHFTENDSFMSWGSDLSQTTASVTYTSDGLLETFGGKNLDGGDERWTGFTLTYDDSGILLSVEDSVYEMTKLYSTREEEIPTLQEAKGDQYYYELQFMKSECAWMQEGNGWNGAADGYETLIANDTTAKNAKNLGYAIKDINGDETPDLIIGNTKSGKGILAFTRDENGELEKLNENVTKQSFDFTTLTR